MSRTPLSTSTNSSSRLRKESTVGKARNDTGDAEPPLLIPSMGKGWIPFPKEQKFRSLNRGPLYDPATFPVIPAPFLMDLPVDNSSEVHHEDAMADDAARYPLYRLVDPLPEPVDDEDEPYAAPLPAACSYTITELLAKIGNPDALIETVDEDMRDVAVTHEAIIAMFQLGKPKGMAEASFFGAVEEVRNVLARQRALFPNKPLDAAATKKPSTLGKKAASSSTVDGSATAAGGEEDNGGRIKVGNPRSAQLQYDDPLLNAARDLLHLPATTSAHQRSTGDVTLDAADPVATWSYDDQMATTQKILKKAEMLRKKQQLYVGYGRSVVFSRVDAPPNANAAMPSSAVFTVDVQRNPPANESQLVGQQPLKRVSTTTLGGSMAVANEPQDASECSCEALLTDAQGSVVTSQEAAGSSSAELQPEGSSFHTVSSSLVPTPSIVDVARDVDGGRYVLPVKNCGDPKTMKLLDKCEWDGEPLSDAFDMTNELHANPSTVLSTDPLLWIERAREAARRGRYDAVAPATIQMVTTFAHATTLVGPAVPGKGATTQASKAGMPAQRTHPVPGTTATVAQAGRPSLVGTEAMLTASTSGSGPLATSVDDGAREPVPSHAADGPASTQSAGQNTNAKSSDASNSAPLPAVRPPSTAEQAEGCLLDVSTTKSKATAKRREVLSRPPKHDTRPTPGAPTSPGTLQVLSPSSEGVGSMTPPERLDVLASLFGANDSTTARLPHNLPPLTVVFPAFSVIAPVLQQPSDDGADEIDVGVDHSLRRCLVSFQQPRPFYLRPPRDEDADGAEENGSDADDDEFWDDAVELLQEDMHDENLVPPTPPSTPVKWTAPPPDPAFVPAPFTQMIIDRLEAGLATPKGSSSDDDDDDNAEGALQQDPSGSTAVAAAAGAQADGGGDQRVTLSKKPMHGEDGIPAQTKPSEAALQAMRALDNEVRLRAIEAASARRQELLLAMRGLEGRSDGSGLDGDARERTLERYLVASKSNIPKRSEPLLLSTKLSMRMEGTTSVVRRLMRRSKKDVLALAKKSKEAQLVSFRPSRRFLAEIMRLRSFGNLVVALLSNPDDPVPEEAVTVSLDDLGRRLQSIWEASPADMRLQLLLSATGNGMEGDHRRGARMWWQSIHQMLADLHRRTTQLNRRLQRNTDTPNGVPWAHVAAIHAAGASKDGGVEDAGKRLLGGRRSSSSMRPIKRSTVRASEGMVDETALTRSSPFLPHFLPSPSGPLHCSQRRDVHSTSSEAPRQRCASTPLVSQATRLAALRRMPRDSTTRGGLDNAYDEAPGQAQRFLRSSGGVESSKRFFAVAKTGLSTHATSRGLVPTALRSGGSLQPQPSPVTSVRATIVYPLPVEFPSATGRDAGVGLLPDVQVSRATEIQRLQRGALRQLHEEWFCDMHDARTEQL